MPTLSGGGGGGEGIFVIFNRSRRITVAIGTTDRMQFPKSSTYVVNAWTFS